MVLAKRSREKEGFYSSTSVLRALQRISEQAPAPRSAQSRILRKRDAKGKEREGGVDRKRKCISFTFNYSKVKYKGRAVLLKPRSAETHFLK